MPSLRGQRQLYLQSDGTGMCHWCAVTGVCYVTWELSTVVERDQQNTAALRKPAKWTSINRLSTCLSVHLNSHLPDHITQRYWWNAVQKSAGKFGNLQPYILPPKINPAVHCSPWRTLQNHDFIQYAGYVTFIGKGVDCSTDRNVDVSLCRWLLPLFVHHQ